MPAPENRPPKRPADEQRSWAAQPPTPLSSQGGVDQPPDYVGAGVAGPYPGMPVIDAEGRRIGQVVEKQGDIVKVSRPNQPDLTVPLQAASVENNVMVLEVPARDVEVFGSSA